MILLGGILLLFDTHVHLNDEAFDDDIEEVIKRAQENDVTRMAVVGFNKETIDRALELAEKYDFISLIVGQASHRRYYLHR